MSYYPPSIRPNGFIETEKKITKITKITKTKNKMKEKEEEEIELTCCGDEITGIVKDIGLCPTCLEHI
jgi:hypothetical protein